MENCISYTYLRCEKFVFEVIFAGLIGLTKEADSVLDDKLLKLQGSEAGSAAENKC